MALLLILGFVALHLLSDSSRRPRTRLEAVAEGLFLFLLGYAVVGACLGALGLYDHRLCSLLLLVWPLARYLRSQEAMRAETRLAAPGGRKAVGLLVVSVLFIAAAAERFEYVEMTGDAGVYNNLAKNLVETGGNIWHLELRNEISEKNPELAQHLFRLAHLPGSYRMDQDEGRIYQFLMGWPALLALGIELFGPYQYTFLLLLLGLFSVFWFYKILDRWIEDRLFLTLATAVFALNPLFVYFSKYTTTEVFLLATVLYLVELHCRETTPFSRVLLAVAAIGVSHISLFLYLPLFALYFLWAAVTRRHDHLRRLAAIGVLFTLSLGLAHLQSPQYFHDIFVFNFGGLLPLPYWAAAILVGFVVLVFSGTALFLARNEAPPRDRLETPFLRAAGLATCVWLIVVLGQIVRSAYLLGWTRHYAEEGVLRGAWAQRMIYVDQAWRSVLHHNVVSIALGTAITLLLVAWLGVLLRRRRSLQDLTDLFLVAGWLWTTTIYVFLRPDTPFNYYASRYFLPVLVPFVMLYGIRFLATLPRKYVLTALLPALAFCVVFTGFQATTPTYQGRHSILRQLDEQLPQDALVAAVGPPWPVHRLVANLVRYDLDGRYLYLGEDEAQALSLLEEIIETMRPPNLYLISNRELRLSGSDVRTVRIHAEDNQYLYYENIVYPLKSRMVTYDLFLLHLDQPQEWTISRDSVLEISELAYLSPQSYWHTQTKLRPGGWSSGSLSLDLPGNPKASEIEILTRGALLEILGPYQLVVEINDSEAFEIMFDEPKEVLDLGRSRRIDRLEILSPTFVPRELGINEDERELGIDLVHLEFR